MTKGLRRCFFRLVPWLGVLLLAACASTSVERNLDATRSFAQERFATELRWLNSDTERKAAQDEVNRRLDNPLNIEDAQRIALAYSPGFQALLADNAAASAQATQSARPSNPVFSFEKLVRKEDGARDLDITRMLSFSLFEILALPARSSIAQSQQQRFRMRSAAQVVQTISETRQAWLRAVAAQQSLIYVQQVMKTAEASAELARRMQLAGNFSRLQRARQQAFYADAAAQLIRAQQGALETHEALIRTLGLDDGQASRLRLPERLPDLPKDARSEQDIMQTALDERIDLRMARFELEAKARNLGLGRVQSVVNGFELAGISNSESSKPTKRGYELSFPLPIFDFGDASRAAGQAEYMAAFNRVAQSGVDASSQVRQQYGAYRSAFDLARHYRDEIVPLRKAISDEVQLKYNGMLESVFELLSDSREQIGSVMAALDAQRDFWLADVALQAALIGKPVGMSGMETSAAGAKE